MVKIFTNDIEPEALEQVYRIAEHPAFKESEIRIMPDVHAGKGCVIGFTAELKDKVVPNLIGVDICCGMLAAPINQLSASDFPLLDQVIRDYVKTHTEPDEYVYHLIDRLKCKDRLKNVDYIACSLGTLGGGNHFIEIDQGSQNYLVVHTGSRNLGKQVCDIYQKQAVKNVRKEEMCLGERKALINSLKAAGRQREIPNALKEFDETHNEHLSDDLCYLTGQDKDNYIHDMKIVGEFADRNRTVIAETIFREMDWPYLGSFTTLHNYIDDNIMRKGAVSAKKGELFLVPLNMAEGSLICEGLGNADWNFSAPHGAGRRLSRKEARNTLDMDEYETRMQGIYTSCVSFGTLDESPMAYKDGYEIAQNIKETAKILDWTRPIYNYKSFDAVPEPSEDLEL